MRFLCGLIFLCALSSLAAELGSPDFHASDAQPVGWRGDGTGRFPGAKPVVEWFRRPKGAYEGIRTKASRPDAGKIGGEPLNMGAIREWLVVGPFDAKDHATALTDEITLNEPALTPADGDALGVLKWKPMPVSVTNQSQSWSRLVLDLALAYGHDERQDRQNHPGTLEPFVAFACSYLFAPEACKVRMRIEGSAVSAWLNTTSVKIPKQYDPLPVVELRQGWNTLLVKIASTKRNWNMSAMVIPAAGSGYETKNVVWMTPMPGPSWSSPIVVGSKIFINADDSTLLCLNKEDGRVLWTRSLTFFHAINEEERKKFPEIAAKVQQLDASMNTLPDLLNANVSNDGSKADGNMALQKKIKEKVELEGKIRDGMGKIDKTYNCWGNDRGWTTPTPVSDGKHVFVAFVGGNKGIGANVVGCFALDGKLIWNHFTGQTGIGEHGTHATPVLCGEFLGFLTGQTMFCYEKASGKVVWQKKMKTGGMSGASAVAVQFGNEKALHFPEYGIYRTADGEEFWKSNVANAIVTPSLVDGTLYGVTETNNVSGYYALSLKSGPELIIKKAWKDIMPKLPGQFTNQIIGSLLYDNGLVYAVSEGGALAVLDAKNAATVYSKALDALNPRLTWVFTVGICTGPTLAGKYIHIRDDQSQTLVIAPGREYKELAKNVLWELSTNGSQQEAQSNPFYEGGRMYYRTQGFLYCIGEK